MTAFGSVVGLFYGFITGFAVGFFTARLYNMLIKLRERLQARQQQEH